MDKCQFCNLVFYSGVPKICFRCKKKVIIYKKVKKWVPKAEKLARASSSKKKLLPPFSEETAKFGEELKRTRIRMLLTQADAAKLLGISTYYFKCIESGRGPRAATSPVHEKLRIWIETNKPMRERRAEGNDPFIDIELLLEPERNSTNGRKISG